MGNFEILKQKWPDLYQHASLAEDYVHVDPHSAMIKLRCFAEVLVGVVYRELNLCAERTDGFFEKLKSQQFESLVDSAIRQKLHAIRLLGNKAAHGHDIKSGDALQLHKEAYLLGQWLYKTYTDENEEYPDYVIPDKKINEIESLAKTNEQLASQLEAEKQELKQLQTAEKQAQKEIASLNLSLDEARLEAFKNAASKASDTMDMEQEKTRQLISMNDVFAEYTLSQGQAELIEKLGVFLSSKEHNVFLLKGYAGTGKTFITKGLTEYFRAIGRNYILAAPTGKASKVIAKKTGSSAYTIHKTIYSFNDIAEYKDEDDLDGSETFKFYARLAVNELSVDTVYIVDEASMVADIYQEAEFFRFGSGYLLSDFLKFVNLDHNDHRKKVIFIGDNAQLPPVGMNFSPALDIEYLSRQHQLRPTGYELTDVVRQKAGSGVMHNSIKVREALQAGVFNQLDIDMNYPDLEGVKYVDLMSRYLESCNKKINAESIVIAYSNADVTEYNRHIREQFFPGCSEITKGDKIMAVTNSNTYGLFISNGDFGLVREVLGETERRTINIRRKNKDSGNTELIPVILSFRDVEVGFRNLDGFVHFFKAKILEGLLYSDQPNLSSDENKALYLDFCIRRPELSRGSLEFKETLVSDPYFTALRLKFGYAITCHKAQGSEWNNVFVKCKTHQSQLSAEYFRWFYTAITRTVNKLYLLDPPHLKLGAGIKVVRSPGLVSKNQVTKSTSEEGLQVEEASKTYDIPSGSVFLLGILKNVNRLIEDKDLSIEDIIHNDYQEAYVFNRGEESCRINIGYNGKNKITSIMMPHVTELGTEIVTLLEVLKGRAVANGNAVAEAEAQFERAFLNDFHQRLMSQTEDQNIVIQDVVEKEWSLRYTFVRNNEIAVYDVWFNGSHKFTKCQPVTSYCTPCELVDDVAVLLTEGLSA